MTNKALLWAPIVVAVLALVVPSLGGFVAWGRIQSDLIALDRRVDDGREVSKAAIEAVGQNAATSTEMVLAQAQINEATRRLETVERQQSAINDLTGDQREIRANQENITRSIGRIESQVGKIGRIESQVENIIELIGRLSAQPQRATRSYPVSPAINERLR